MTMPVSFHIRPQDQEEVPGQEGCGPPRRLIYLPLSPRYRGLPFQVVHLHLLHILLQLQQMLPGLPIQHTIHRSTPCQLERDSWCDGCHLLTRSYTGCQDQRLAQCHSMLTQIMTHLGLLVILLKERSPPLMQLHWMSWLQLQQLQIHHHHSSEVVRFLFDLCTVTSFINCLLILIRIFVLAIVAVIFLCLACYACISHFGYIKSYSVYIYSAFCISCLVSPLCVYMCFSFKLNN